MEQRRTILAALTWDGRSLIVTPTGGTPIVLHEDDAFATLKSVATDETIPPAKTTSAGFDIGDVFSGIGKVLADMGKSEAPKDPTP